MQKVCIIGAVGAFFKSVVTRIICIIGARYVNFGRRVRGGVDYWRGHVFGGGAVGKKGGAGVNVEQIGAAQSGFVTESASLDGLTVSLSRHAKAGGGFHINGEAAAHQINESFHVRPRVTAPRGRVMVVGKNFVLRRGELLCQLVVDGSPKGESVSFMPL